MRKLLVASQKSGVGKTTTSINLAAATAMAGARVLLVEADPLGNVGTSLNLAQHPQRQQLRAAGVNLPGVLCAGVVPGLDVVLPYDEGGCSDEDLDMVLQLLTSPVFKESYDCLVINAPPFLGARPGQLLASSDEFVVVMQAEPLAYRTMPAFLEMVQRSVKADSLTIRMRGIVLTLPESETPGGRAERELRGRFGTRILPHVVPHDEEVGKAALFGHALAHASPEAPAALAYHDLQGELQLARDATGASPRPADATLQLAAAAVRERPLVARQHTAPAVVRKSSGWMKRLPPTAAPPRSPEPPRPQTPEPADDPHVPEPRPVRPSGLVRPLPPAPSRPSPDDTPVAPRRSGPAPPPLHTTPRPYLVWIGFAIVLGIGLRFLALPDFMLPVMVGLAVTAGVTLVLHLLLSQLPAATTPAGSTATSRRSGLHKKLPPVAGARSDA